MTTAVLALLAYLLGSLPFAVIVSRGFGLADPRTYGSKNPGATNVLRSGNKLAAALTLLGDAAKGWLAVWAAMRFGPQFGATKFDVALVAVCVFLGHVLPVFLRFRGGKGVATAAGVLLALNGWLGIAVLAVWLGVALVFRYSSLAAVVAAAVAPFVALKIFGADDYFAAVTVMSAVLIIRHIGNIKRLSAGQEGRIGRKKDAQAGADKS
jgi:glycerol-3-phosphate acyltransferase PlsY